ncbi:TetR/AcrR family transcriptional regulator [Streptomyces sp. NPDC050549]|uniref:TetR/AcrR family transcriptional regulator n=1 Tax=Streptomyces sp. NPDC050549 TaxID=3155406 RepID=UPI003415FC6B
MAELIADGQPSDAGLVNVCQRAGVSRGALYHHFSSTAMLAAAVYEQAHQQVLELVDKAFEGPSADAPQRFLMGLGAMLRTNEVVRAGMRLAADGSFGLPRLRDQLLAAVRERITEVQHGAVFPAEDLADLVVVMTAGLEELGHVNPEWWGDRSAERLWAMLRPLFSSPDAAADRRSYDTVSGIGTARIPT